MLSLNELAKEGKLEKTGAKPKLPIKVDGVSSETLDVYKIIFTTMTKMGELRLVFPNIRMNCIQQMIKKIHDTTILLLS